jgi:RimJ/RimL family protein N-acetyltransferase
MTSQLLELGRANYSLVRPFFQETVVGHSFIAALLDGNHLGRVFVDDAAAPTTAVVALASEFTYIAGRTGDAALHAAVTSLIADELTRGQEYAVLFATSDAWTAALEVAFGDAPELHHGARDEYAFDPTRFAAAHEGWRARVPEGFGVLPYDEALAEGQGFEAFWGSIARFLECGVGYAVIRDGEAVSRCHSVLVGAGEAEISIETAEDYRRQGLATLAACAYIERCFSVGLRPAWSNWSTNTASRHLAERLGFVHRGTTPALIVKLR